MLTYLDFAQLCLVMQCDAIGYDAAVVLHSCSCVILCCCVVCCIFVLCVFFCVCTYTTNSPKKHMPAACVIAFSAISLADVLSKIVK